MHYCLFLSLLATGTLTAKTVTPSVNNKNAETTAVAGDSVIADGVYASYANPFNTQTIPDDIFNDDVYADEPAATDVKKADEIIVAAADKSDADEVVTSLEVDPNPTTGIITIKTQSAGKIYFYSKKGKEKGECVVDEGTSVINLNGLIFPGTYTCRFEGQNGSVAETKVIYKL